MQTFFGEDELIKRKKKKKYFSTKKWYKYYTSDWKKISQIIAVKGLADQVIPFDQHLHLLRPAEHLELLRAWISMMNDIYCKLMFADPKLFAKIKTQWELCICIFRLHIDELNSEFLKAEQALMKERSREMDRAYPQFKKDKI